MELDLGECMMSLHSDNTNGDSNHEGSTLLHIMNLESLSCFEVWKFHLRKSNTTVT